MLFEHSLEVVTNLQEDPNLQILETQEKELQQRYDEFNATTCTITFTQGLEKLEEEKALKEHVYVAQCREAVLKARLGPWLDEAYVLTTTIEGKLVSLQETQQKIQADSTIPMMK